MIIGDNWWKLMIIGNNFFWLSWGQYGKMGLDDLKSSLVLVPEGKPPKKVKSKQIDALDHDDNYQSQRRLNKRQRRCRYWSQEEHRRQCNQDRPDCTHHKYQIWSSPIQNIVCTFTLYHGTNHKYPIRLYIVHRSKTCIVCIVHTYMTIPAMVPIINTKCNLI